MLCAPYKVTALRNCKQPDLARGRIQDVIHRKVNDISPDWQDSPVVSIRRNLFLASALRPYALQYLNP